MIIVVNKKNHRVTANDFYCGRGSPLGNPFPISETLSRDKCIEKYKNFLLEKIRNKDESICMTLNQIYTEAKTKNINLVCYCKPLKCHCDFIKQLIEQKLLEAKN